MTKSVDYIKLLDEVKQFIFYKIEEECDWNISLEKYKDDVNNAIRKLIEHYRYSDIGYCSMTSVEAQCWYYFYTGKGVRSYINGKLWKETAKYVFQEVRKQLVLNNSRSR